MVTEKNLGVLEDAEGEWGFLPGMTRRQNPAAEALIDRVDENRWRYCAAGIRAREKHEPPRTRVQEVACDRVVARVFVVDSDERRAYEQRRREKVMERARAGSQKVQTRVAKGQLKKAEKIGAAVERIMQRHHGHRYYDWKSASRPGLAALLFRPAAVTIAVRQDPSRPLGPLRLVHLVPQVGQVGQGLGMGVGDIGIEQIDLEKRQ